LPLRDIDIPMYPPSLGFDPILWEGQSVRVYFNPTGKSQVRDAARWGIALRNGDTKA